MKIHKKLAKVLIIFLLFSIITMPLVQAVDIQANEYKPHSAIRGTEDTKKIFEVGGKLWGALSTVGIVVSVISLAIIGLRSVFGTLEDKAAYKKAMMPYIVGLCLVAGISMVVNVIYDFANDISREYTVIEKKSQGGI